MNPAVDAAFGPASELKTASAASQTVAPPQRPRALFILDAATTDLVYGPEERATLEELADVYAPPQTRDSLTRQPELLRDAEVIFSGWGAPKMDAAFLEAAPNLQAVFYAAGSIRSCTSEAFWDRGIVISSAYGANGLPVAEYTLGVTLLSLKKFWHFAALANAGDGWGDHTRHMPGCFGTTVALIGCGAIARRVITLLKPFDIRCVVYDPFLTESDGERLGVELCSLEEAFRRGDVVSLHAPAIRETRGMVAGRHFSLMKEGATFINSARGSIVREGEMIDVLRERRDLTAILDVCDPEPVPAGSPLLALPNTIVTSHISGSHGPECRRLGRYMVEEFQRYQAGEPLRWRVTRERALRMA